MGKVKPVGGYEFEDRYFYEGIDPASQERFYYRAEAGEVRVAKSEREEAALEHAVELELAKRVKLSTQAQINKAKGGGASTGARRTAAADRPQPTEESAPTGRVELYKDQAGEWRWRRVAPNGNVTAESGEGYSRKTDARQMAAQANEGLEIVEVQLDTEEGE